MLRKKNVYQTCIVCGRVNLSGINLISSHFIDIILFDLALFLLNFALAYTRNFHHLSSKRCAQSIQDFSEKKFLGKQIMCADYAI